MVQNQHKFSNAAHKMLQPMIKFITQWDYQLKTPFAPPNYNHFVRICRKLLNSEKR